MAEAAADTAYYLNRRTGVLALIAKGVQLPAGTWIRIASSDATAWQAEDLVRDLFPALREAPLSFQILLTDFDVAEYERLAGAAR